MCRNNDRSLAIMNSPCGILQRFLESYPSTPYRRAVAGSANEGGTPPRTGSPHHGKRLGSLIVAGVKAPSGELPGDGRDTQRAGKGGQRPM